MRNLKLIAIAFALAASALAQATEKSNCKEPRLSESAITEKMNQLQKNLKAQKPEDRKQTLQKALNEMNCQIDMSANDKNLDSPARWKSIQAQDLLNLALKSNCDPAKINFALKSEGAANEDTPDTITKSDQDFLKAYCEK